MVAAFDNSPRQVPLQHMQKLVLTAAGNPPDPPPLPPNHLQLYSYYKPGLLAGSYAIEAQQRITSQNRDYGTEHYHVYNRKKAVTLDRTKPDFDPNPPIEDQLFEVANPQFNIDPKLINSYYPPDGHQDEGRILPHICLEDPHFPWERQADTTWDQLLDGDKNADKDFIDAGRHVVAENDALKRNAIPWIALMVFDHEDLPPLTEGDARSLTADNTIPSWVDLTKQSSNGAFLMKVKDYMDIPVSSRVNFEKGEVSTLVDELKDVTNPSSQERMTAIFPQKATFKKLFPDISRLRYAAHVRNINTTGFPDAGINQMGLYSIVLSSRTGSVMQTKPVTQICHLVSVEHFEKTKQSLTGGDTDRIGLVSLFSWTYTALPPDPVNFVDSIRHYLDGMQMLCPSKDVLGALNAQALVENDTKKQKALESLSQRFTAGYTLARWRAETGEETVAFSRGPLVPQNSPFKASYDDPNSKVMGAAPVADWPFSSNTSKEFQILDTATGIMDLSYSSAWQLGKTLAISDTSFSSALSRLRSWIQKWSQSKTRSEANNVPAKSALITNMGAHFQVAGDLSSGNVSDPQRVIAPTNRELAPPLHSPDVAPLFDQNIRIAVETAGSAGDEIYNEFNKVGHNNSDWTVIHKWISEKLYLTDIPAHILIPDPSFLPEESLRFFNIDDTWLDCLIDGALSVANHLERDDDKIRQEIKQLYNAYLRATIEDTGVVPQIPGYGFILRSQIVKVMPDLRITVTWQTSDARYPFCRYTRPDDHTILCLLDRPPEELKFIEFAQPPHQQRFAFGDAFDPKAKQFKFKLRKMFTDGTKPEVLPGWAAMPDVHQPNSEDLQKWLPDSSTRIIDFASMAPRVNELVREDVKQAYNDYVANSAELALELNDPSYFFLIYPDSGTAWHSGQELTPRHRQLWCPKVLPLADTTTGTLPGNPPDSEPIGPPPLPPKHSDSTSPVHPITKAAPDKATNIVFKDTPAVPANPSQPLSTSQPTSCFNIQIFADYKGPPKIWTDDNAFDRANYLPTQNDYLYDLVFSVRKLATKAKADYRLREIIINIPHSGIAAPAEPLINSASPSPRARMLSNQRFVPFLNWTKDFLQVRLVPRSAEDHPVIVINDRRSREISFRLEEVDIPGTRTKSWVPIHGGPREQLGVCKVMIYERYETPAGVMSAAPAPTNVFLVKKDVRDDVKYG